MSEKQIVLARPVAWRYATPVHVGRCRIDGKELTVRLTLSSPSLQIVPDVLDVEAWLRALLKAGQTTVEEVAVAAAERWAMRAEASGESRTHGTITAACEV